MLIIGKLFQGAVVVMALFMVVRTSAFHSIPKSRFFLLLAFSACLYAFGYLMELDAGSTEAAYMALRLQAMGTAPYTVLMYLFVREYGNRPFKKRWYGLALLALPVVILAAANAYPHLRWYIRGLRFTAHPVPHLTVERGVLFAVKLLYSSAFILFAALEVLLYYPSETKGEKRMCRLFLLVIVMPLLAVACESGLLPLTFQPASALLVAALFVLGAFVARQRVGDWLPYAREQIMEHLEDGYILVDPQYRFLDANLAAVRYFPRLEGVQPGSAMGELEGLHPSLQLLPAADSEITVQRDGKPVVLRVSLSPVRVHGKLVCHGILLYDVTDLRRLMDELKAIASTDSLTGLMNRRAFFDAATRDFTLHRRSKLHACVMMLDIDHFKQVNDTHGHLCGDHVLEEVSHIISERLRRTDFRARYGGEEFCLFLPVTNLSGAIRTANAIRAAVETRLFNWEDNVFSVTISIGLTVLDPYRHVSLEDMIADADAALYQAKHAGRNKVQAWRAGCPVELFEKREVPGGM